MINRTEGQRAATVFRLINAGNKDGVMVRRLTRRRVYW